MPKDHTQYDKQDRGAQASYEAYFAGMDSSMQQKVALTTAHFPVRGRIADMGSGSGRGTFDLASLYHGLELVGVDINPISVQRAAEKFRRPNLSYVVGDISEMVFPKASLDGILDSSVLHHVTSFNNFDVNRVFATFDNQVAQLKPGGVIIIRDFVIPDGPEYVFLDLPANNGKDSGTIKELSTAALFRVFAKQWRSSINPNSEVSFIQGRSPYEGFVRFEVTLRVATEFVLRKDYRADWDTEVLEEYTYLTQQEFQTAFRSRGLRIVTSRPLWNPWIVENRFQGKFHLSNLEQDRLPFPPTNYLIVGEKISAHDGVALIESASKQVSQPKFLSLTAHRHKETNEVFELVERPHQTVDILPWFADAESGQLFVLAKKDFPRPLINAATEQPRLAKAVHSGYVTEPISAIADPVYFNDTVAQLLSERANLAKDDLISVGEPFNYYTSPGAVNEVVNACLVQIRPKPSFSNLFPNYTSFASAGTVRELDAQQVLRACHVGGMFDARIEINIYRLFHEQGRKPGPWIGAPIKLNEQAVTYPEKILKMDPAAAFVSCELPADETFLLLKEGVFDECDSSDKVLARVNFEYVIPKTLSLSTATALPVCRTTAGVFVGVERRDLPAVQEFSGSSRITTVPAWRLPQTLKHISDVPEFVAEGMSRDFSVQVIKSWELGGSYFSTPGVTPEVVYPYVVEVDGSDLSVSSLTFIRLDQLCNNFAVINDAHLLVAAYRLRHAIEAD